MVEPKDQKEKEFLKVYEENKDTVYRICCYYLSDKESRKDLFQDIWTAVFRNLESFEGRSSIRTWIYRIATNTALMAINRQSLRENKRYLNPENIINAATSQPATEKLELEENINQMLSLVNNLLLVDKAIIPLVLEEASGKEIADVVGLSEENVRVRIHRIKKKLAEDFKNTGSHV